MPPDGAVFDKMAERPSGMPTIWPKTEPPPAAAWHCVRAGGYLRPERGARAPLRCLIGHLFATLAMKSYLLFLACFLLLADASAQQSSKAKSKDRYHEKDQVLPPAEIAVSDAQSFAPLKDVELRLLYMSPQGYMDGRGMSHVFELQEQEKSAKIINYRDRKSVV